MPSATTHRATGTRQGRRLLVTVETTHPATRYTWFRGRQGRRYGIEFAAIVVGKLILLMVIWAVCIRPQPRADTAPAAVEQHLLAPVAAEEIHDR